MTDLIGQHVQGGAGRTWEGLRHAAATGATAAQVFAAGSMGYAVRESGPDRLAEVRAMTRDIHTLVHGSYILTLTQRDARKIDLAGEATIKTLRWAEKAGAHAVVIHPGSTRDESWRRLARLQIWNLMHHYRGPVKLLLETLPGNTSLGSDVADLVELCRPMDRVGICVDLTHSWSAGLTVAELCALPSQYLGMIKACHFNMPAMRITRGCHNDRHNVSLTDGPWTLEEVAQLWWAYRWVPCILEGTPTPERDYALLRRM